MKFLTIFFIMINILSLLGFSNIYINARNKVYERVKVKDLNTCLKPNSNEGKSFIILTYIEFVLMILEIMYILLSLKYIDIKLIGLVYIAFRVFVVIIKVIKGKIRNLNKEAYVKPLGFKHKMFKSIDTLIFISYLGYMFYSLFAHSMIYGLGISFILYMMGHFSIWKALILVISHIVIDYVKSHSKNKDRALTSYLYIDQALHIGINILMLAC